ncbi:unnamed protein product [Gongylonema pulchrum]|uniref:DUF5641 domain-containing protein n=1 Tax=Gongylonema pulchrum TaxID=637853 RepID=A0A183D6X5_9BILA|nr:unnamed protein product [Gongylonema pulchrum]
MDNVKSVMSGLAFPPIGTPQVWLKTVLDRVIEGSKVIISKELRMLKHTLRPVRSAILIQSVCTSYKTVPWNSVMNEYAVIDIRGSNLERAQKRSMTVDEPFGADYQRAVNGIATSRGSS